MREAKKCSKCEETKPVAEFYKDKQKPDGLYSSCKSCVNLNKEPRQMAVRKYVQANRDKLNENKRKKRAETPHSERYTDYERMMKREYYYKNKDVLNLKQRVRYHSKPDSVKLEIAQKQKEANAKRKHAVRYTKRKYKLKRKINLAKATPSWKNDFFISEIYDLAELRTDITGVEWHVDHVVPLCSDYVCGLHCEQNMDVIIGVENSRKSNLWWPDMPEYTAQDLHELRYFKWLADNANLDNHQNI